ncbi:aldo-keto reductase family 1 member C1 homolog isoform X4 [Heterocephalus glaber]|uniref:Aldo-keto reductase family 1 member C1 homolog isoform X4 n=1 Tax=Heterocephalus glaber TaxID=10181 RepID=A0AAX6RIB0_HETGA|nr:aldo-keto reductase family 1 member C1 homolog isoform X4 [Heterocephalus glaber]
MDHKHLRVALNDGHSIPVLGFGTSIPSKLPKSKALEATKLAIDAGFRHFDCAYCYQNEEEVGLAIRSKIADGIVKREEIFYTSKPGENLLPKDDHGKLLCDTVDLCDTWAAMEKCKDAGLAKSIGVSNFNRRQLEMILNKPGLKYKPVCNQVECHPYLNQRKLLDFCKSKDIVLVAYSALGTSRDKLWVDASSPVLLEDPVLCALAKKHQRSSAQIALRYQLQRGVVVLAHSVTEKRIRENMQVFEFQLTSEDMKSLDGLNRNFRYNTADYFDGHPSHPFSDEY